MCVIGSTDDMVCVLGKDAFTLVCVLTSYAGTCSYTCRDTLLGGGGHLPPPPPQIKNHV